MSLRERFEEETGVKAVFDEDCKIIDVLGGRPSVEYMFWLESLCTSQAEELESAIVSNRVLGIRLDESEKINAETIAELEDLKATIDGAEIKWAVIDGLGSYKIFTDRVMAYACSEDGDKLQNVAIIELSDSEEVKP